MKKVTVIGLGIIGSEWAKHYSARGVLAATWNRSPKPESPQWHPDICAAASVGDIIHIVIGDPPAVRSVLGSIKSELGPGKIVVQSSTIDPDSSDEFRLFVRACGAGYLEAPFTGSKPAAEAGTLVFYLGGDAELQDEVEPYLAMISETRFRVGTNRQASMLKLAMNLNIAAQMEALAEALTIARKAGIADEIFFPVIAKNVSYSGVTKLKEDKLRSKDFSPQFSVKHLLKDMRLAAAALGESTYPALESVRKRLELAQQSGFGDEDFSALIKLYRGD